MRTPTFAVDGHMTWRSKKSVNPDGGVEVSMTCDGVERTKKSWECVLKNVMRTPTLAVDDHMTLMDPCGKKSVSPDGGVEVSMTCVLA